MYLSLTSHLCYHSCLPTEGSELFNLNSNVSATNQDVLEGLQQWQTRLQRARDSAVKFDRDYNSFSRWLSDMERKLNTDEGMRGTVEGVETQIRNTKVHVHVFVCLQ